MIYHKHMTLFGDVKLIFTPQLSSAQQLHALKHTLEMAKELKQTKKPLILMTMMEVTPSIITDLF